MRDQNQRGAVLAVAGKQQFDDLLAGLLVEISGRLVGDQNCRIGRERAGDRDTLLQKQARRATDAYAGIGHCAVVCCGACRKQPSHRCMAVGATD